MTQLTSLRLPAAVAEQTASLASKLSARAAGARITKSRVLLLAIDRGLEALRAEVGAS